MRGAALALAVALGGGCASTAAVHTRVLHVDEAARGEGQGRATHFALPLASGQLVLSEAPGPHSLLFGLAPAAFHRFTHAAVVIVDEKTGEPFVYDMSAEFKPGFATTPADALHGGLRRTPFLEYVSLHLYAEVVEPPAGVDRAKVAARVAALWAEKPAFDPSWDYGDRSKLFCTELVAEALAAGGGAAPALEPLNENPSLRRVLSWFGVRGDRSLPAGAFERDRPVAVFSRWPSRGAAAGYFAAKRELHRRFTADQKIGNLMILDGVDVRLRPEVEAFLERATRLGAGAAPAAEPPADELRARVEALAVELLGPFPV